MYLQVVGTAAVNDECTTVGPVLTSPIITFAPGEIMTWAPKSTFMSYQLFESGAPWGIYDNGMEMSYYGDVKTLLVKDLVCPTWGLGRSTAADGAVFNTVGSPFLPLIIPPVQAFSLDPTWSALCSRIFTANIESGNFAILDPPTALTPVPRMVAAPTTAPALIITQADPNTAPEAHATASTTPTKPATPPTYPEAPPIETGDPLGGSKMSSPSAAAGSPSLPPSQANGPMPYPTDSIDSQVTMIIVPPADPITSATGDGDPPADPAIPLPASPNLPPGDSSDPPSVSKAPNQIAPPLGDNSQTQTQGLGAIIYNAFGGSGPQDSGGTSKTYTISLPASGFRQLTIDGSNVLSMNPSGVLFEGNTFSAGGPALTIAGSVFTLVPPVGNGDTIFSDESSDPADNLPAALDPLILTGQTLVSNPSGVVIDGSTQLPGGNAFTISNTPISLNPSRTLVFGSSSITPPPQSIFIIGSQTFTAKPTGFPVQVARISPGAPAQTIEGTVISLGLSGALAIGSSTFALAANSAFMVAGQVITPNPSAFSIAGTIVSAGGPAITVDGTVVRLGRSGALFIGSSIFTIPPPAPPVNDPLVIAGQTITPSASAFSIAGTTISAGGPPVTINGTIVSLQPSGSLIVGSSTLALSAPLSSMYDIDGFNVEAGSSFAVLDGVTVSPGAMGVTIGGDVVSLESGGKTLDVGSGRFAMPTGSVNRTAKVQIFDGGQGKRLKIPVLMVLWAGFFAMVMVR
ncbi:hypothetical protein MMC28_007458 [Mycoblastus sanguinarius]|nr:hypothetical protein [Mycoblastus sanguinarius]